MKFEYSLLNKFNGKRLSDFLKPSIPEYNKKLIELKNEGKTGKEAVITVLNQYINSNSEESEFDLDSIEEAFFLFLFFQDQDTYYHKKIIEIPNLSEIWEQLQSSKFSSYLDKKLYDLDDSQGIVSIRKEQNSLLCLFNIGICITPNTKEEKQFLVSCRINLDSKIISIGIKDSMFSKIRDQDKTKFGGKRYDLIKSIFDQIDKMILGIEIKKFEEAQLESALYKLFKEQSEKAEDLIKRNVEEVDSNISVEQLKEEAEEFLSKNFLLKEPEKFVEKALSIKYQDQASRMSIETFINDGGYVFGFSFVEKQLTRSDNKNDKKTPIYESKLYWNLKEIIAEYSNLSKLSVFWKFNKDNFDIRVSETLDEALTFVEVDYKIGNNELITHYYVDSSSAAIEKENSFDRIRREDYALRQIIRYLH
ncbi:hypothetical protein [Enterococcus bulliens]